MNILIPYSWLKDYVSLKAPVSKVAEYLSLYSFSVEKIKKEKNDHIFEIEITPNRGDALSVLGIARELSAIFSLKLKQEKEIKEKKKKPGIKQDILSVEIKDKKLVPRFSAIVLDNVKVGKSPKFIEERLKKAGIRPINNIVDITNYLMIDRGQPMHVFDYEKIKGSKMVIQESKAGEKITTLDNVERTLPKGVIIIKDAEKRLIDLCGIMGAKNSEVDEKTKKVLLFVQVYEPSRIRKASMSLGHRTDAALRFEKGVDFEGVLPALWKAVDFAEKYAFANVSSVLIDIKNMAYKPKQVKIDYQKICNIAGVQIAKQKINNILERLGFQIKQGKAIVPSWRSGDIEIAEDLAEEVARLYGYHNLASEIFKGELPEKEQNDIFYFEDMARDFLKYMGFYECYTNTLTKKENVSSKALEVLNPLNAEMTHFRTSLLPQLKEVILKNKERKECIMVFEISNIFIPQKNNLPFQPVMLGIAVKGIKFLKLKGIAEALLQEMGVKEKDFSFEIKEIGKDILGLELNFEEAVSKAETIKKYTPISKFNSIKEDITLDVPSGVLYPEIKKTILEASPKIQKLDFKYIYKNFITLSVHYLDTAKQISSEDTQKIREKIFQDLNNKLNVKLKV